MAQREAQLAAVLAELSGALMDGHDLPGFLLLLAERSVEVLEATAAGVMLMDDEGQLDLVAGSSGEMQRLEVFAARLREGPCYDAWRRGVSMSIGDLGACERRWPHFVPEATRAGYASVLAQPLRVRQQAVGALNVVSNGVDAFDDSDSAVAQGLADIAALTMLHHRASRAADTEIRRLEEALRSRAVVDQAKALVAERLGCPLDEGFDRLRRYARNHNEKLADVAHEYLRGDLTDQSLSGDGS